MLETKPLTPTDRWCCHGICPYIGHPYDEDGKSICIRCKTEHIAKMEEENAKAKRVSI